MNKHKTDAGRMAPRSLVAQAETQKPSSTGHYFGYEVFDVEGSFVLVVHTSLYTGIQRTSHWACPPVEMQSLTKEGAIQEAARTTAAYARSLNPSLDVEI